MNNQVEKINFYGDELLGFKDDEGIVWLVINRTCKCLGMTEDQAKKQGRNIQNDIVLSMGAKKLSAKFDTELQSREMLCIQEKYITLWLAKISITPTMKKDNPDLVDKLVKYQLECAEVLHNHFIGTEEKKQNFYKNMLGIEDIQELLNEQSKIFKSQIDILKSDFDIFKQQQDSRNEQLYFLVKRFDVYENEDVKYTRLIDDLNAKLYDKIVERHKHYRFWEEVSNWLDLDFDKLLKENDKKQFLLNKVGIDVLSYFVDNVLMDRIVKNENGKWVNLQGFNSDPFGIEKNKIKSYWTDKNGKIRCCYCGKVLKDEENISYNYEHYIAKTRTGSSNNIDNLGIACCDCNKNKNSLNYNEFVPKESVHFELLQGRIEEWRNLYKNK